MKVTEVTAGIIVLVSASLIDLGAAKTCGQKEISGMDVSGCDCSDGPTGCNTNCPVCDINPLMKNINNCDGGCTDKESDCTACGIYYHTLCNCLKHGKPCPNSGTISAGGPAVWVYEAKGGLITTTDVMPGIRQMRPQHERAWTYAQEIYKPGFQSLWLNSVRARDMEQIHIHVCPTRNLQTTNTLTDEHIKSGKDLVQTFKDPDLFCLGVNQSTTISNFATAVSNFLANPPSVSPKICRDEVGAGILQDHKSRTWACVSTNRHGPKEKFC
ncbi:Cullin-1 [Purpureocillium lavendulum]|uniref:Cullin-1 n=1 Tax=Purpureocillium lavendulum TaxID=1247861 RepID=A0AB34FYE2_9HYPO|nr:Cullin-1 [Purpureocillium lavendulum]